MELFSSVEWDKLFIPDTPLLEIFVRGSIIYLSLFFLLRFILKRQAGAVGISDLLVIVLIADAAQNGMSDDYRSITDGILLVSTLIFWNFTLEWLSYRFLWFEKLISPAPLLLIKNGRVQHKNLKAELITPDELKGQLRLQGIDDIRSVKKACLEGDGKISIVENKHSTSHKPRDSAI